ncbi:MAG: ATP-binding cassette domain-containing protein, partial [Clostridia bacterium]|nr:ATP-binding cassette domain-containing protein [Clostridia bacterium]
DDAVSMKIRGDITFDNVHFGYDDATEVLKGINLEVKEGEFIGIVGKSGAGKSTLINLVMRMYDVEDGCIRIDGTDIRDISQESLRSQIGVVLQETFLFSGSIYDNIAYAKPGATRDEIITASKIAGAHEFIMKLPDAYNTKVGEKGHTLSGGERQRISIARALLHNPRILILDEATASLDTETEKQIQDALQKLSKNRTTLAIAHRLSTLRNATRLIVIDKGKIAEVGTHEELIRMKGIYFNLVMAQRQMSKMTHDK